MDVLQRLRHAWQGLTGETAALKLAYIDAVRDVGRLSIQAAKAHQLERDLHLAKAGIAELQRVGAKPDYLNPDKILESKRIGDEAIARIKKEFG